MRAKHLRGTGIVVFGFGIVASCRTDPSPPPAAPPAPTLSTNVEPPVPELDAPSDAAAPEAATADAGSAPAVVAPAKDPLRRPDPGPGQVACGDAACKAGAEICAPREECVERKDKACVALADFKARKYASTACVDGCFSWFDEKACDGPSDCKTGEVCCYDSDLIIGPCDDGEDGMIDVYQCKPAGKGRTPCGTAELCSAKDKKCTRAGSTCVVSPETGLGRCVVPRRRAAQPDPVSRPGLRAGRGVLRVTVRPALRPQRGELGRSGLARLRGRERLQGALRSEGRRVLRARPGRAEILRVPSALQSGCRMQEERLLLGVVVQSLRRRPAEAGAVLRHGSSALQLSRAGSALSVG